MKQKEYVDNYLDPELAEETRVVITELYRQRLARLKQLADRPPLPDQNEHLQKSVANYGEKWLNNVAALEKAESAREHRIDGALRTLATLKTFLTIPPKRDKDDEKTSAY